MPAGTWDQKRQALLRQLLERQPQGRNKITIVYDSREGGGEKTRHGDLHIVFTAGITADDWIIHHVRVQKNPRVLRVVTDDKGLQRMIRGTGAESIGTAAF